MSEKAEHQFTCKNCGSHDLRVVREYMIVNYCTETLPCDCGSTSDGIAAQYDYHVATSYREWGLLDDTHHWEKEESEKLDEPSEEDGFEVFCEKCYETAPEDDWQQEEENAEQDSEQAPDSTEFYVYCDRCEREIEFGWSHPDRGGRIWPAECTDFNPWKSWPEPRYRESWAKKNWLRPD